MRQSEDKGIKAPIPIFSTTLPAAMHDTRRSAGGDTYWGTLRILLQNSEEPPNPAQIALNQEKNDGHQM